MFEHYLNIFINTVFIENIALSLFLGMCTFLAISKIIKTILNDRNYKKYAIKHPKNINKINKVDFWARKTTMSKI